MSADSHCYSHLSVALVMCPLDEDGFIYRWDAFDVSELDQTAFIFLTHLKGKNFKTIFNSRQLKVILNWYSMPTKPTQMNNETSFRKRVTTKHIPLHILEKFANIEYCFTSTQAKLYTILNVVLENKDMLYYEGNTIAVSS